MITQEKLKSLVHYDQDTGIFTWVYRPFNCVNIGDVAGCSAKGYIKIRINGKLYQAHRLAWLYMYGYLPKLSIDHINCNPADNRICNLRELTQAENSQNVNRPHKDTASKILGAYFNKRKHKWYSRIMTNGNDVYLGYFESASEAAKAYLQAKRKLHPSFVGA